MVNPLTQVERNARSRTKRVADGGMELPRSVLPVESAEAIRSLLQNGNAPSITGTIARAVTEADKRRKCD